ncbi:hypothetical protein KVR01_004159 [Diaporthe batatas]|uniref:uncharacterized protein n=1 Tax=Diaporthe batatas TaxID=748121 RepID=UPI001D04BA3C|nr:uncharacterized protein KVR01_004159 [Diaporthe batatas]KAG8165607.1 hypothetical protein KVR01_004159 [Diaporthe batatas]
MTSSGARPEQEQYCQAISVPVLTNHPKFRVDNPGLQACPCLRAGERHPHTTRAATLFLEELMRSLPLDLVTTRTAELPGGTVQKSGPRQFSQLEVSATCCSGLGLGPSALIATRSIGRQCHPRMSVLLDRPHLGARLHPKAGCMSRQDPDE